MSNKKRTKGPGPWCGTPGGYRNHGCRCGPCRRAHADACAEYMAARPEQQEMHRQRQRERRQQATAVA